MNNNHSNINNNIVNDKNDNSFIQHNLSYNIETYENKFFTLFLPNQKKSIQIILLKELKKWLLIIKIYKYMEKCYLYEKYMLL